MWALTQLKLLHNGNGELCVCVLMSKKPASSSRKKFTFICKKLLNFNPRVKVTW